MSEPFAVPPDTGLVDFLDHAPRIGPSVYFLAVHDRVKIGYARDLYSRLLRLRYCCPYKVALVAWIECADVPACQAEETRQHVRWGDDRYHGEWFYLRGELAAYVAEANARAVAQRAVHT